MNEDKELIRAVKYLKSEKRKRTVDKILGAFGRIVPKGIRHPDSLVANRHLYIPHTKGKTRLR